MKFRLTFFVFLLSFIITFICWPAAHGQNNSSNSSTQNSTNTTTTEQNGISAIFLFKCHGVLMTLAWLLMAPCAILYARFLRDPLKRVLGDQLWFQVHRLLNTLTFLCVLIALICVICATGGKWEGPTIYKTYDQSFSWYSLHALFGLVTFLLTIFQPFSALFRCHSDSTARVVFNVLHAFTGYIAWLAALTTICIACVHFRLFSSPGAATVLIIVFLVLLAVVGALMQIVAIRKEQEETECIGQSVLFIILAVICSAISVAISFLIILA